MREVVVGDVLHWFNGGRSEVPPCAAMVLVVNPGGQMLTLKVTNQDGQDCVVKNVWPVGHQTLSENPAIASRSGAWAWRRPEPVEQKVVVEQPPFSTESDGSKPELPKKTANSKA